MRYSTPMADLAKLLAAVAALAAVAVGGWIGYRATDTTRQCFPTNGAAIMCLEHGHNTVYPPHVG